MLEGGLLQRILSKRSYTLLFFAAVSLAPRLYAWTLMPMDWNPDSYHHWQISYLSLKIGFPRFRMWDINGCDLYWGIVPHLVQATLMWAFRTASILPYRVLNIVLAGLNAYLVYCIGRDNFSWEVGFSAGVLYALYPVAVVFDIIAMQETLALLSMQYYVTHPGRSGIFLALAAQSRTEYWLASIFFVACATVIERFSVRFQEFAFSWMGLTLIFSTFFRFCTGNPLYPLYWSLFNVFGGWTEEGLGLPFHVLFLNWARRKLLAWSGKGTGLFLLGSMVSFGGASLYMMFRKRRSYHVFLFSLDVLAVFSPLFVTYYPNYMQGLLLMLRGSMPIAAFGLIVICYTLFLVRLRLPEGRMVMIVSVALMTFASVVSLGYVVPAYGRFHCTPKQVFEVADNTAGHYMGGTIVCDYPMLNYRLVSKWGVKASSLLGNHYAPHYYGATDPVKFARWFEKNNVTLWLYAGDRADPVWRVVQNNFPELLVLMEEAHGIRVYRVDRSILQSILN